MEDKIVIELEQVTEQTYDMLGANIKYMLSRMFAGAPINAMVRGPQNKVHAFLDTLKGEKNFLAKAKRYGLDDPMVHKDRMRLMNAVKNFERETGLTWPFK